MLTSILMVAVVATAALPAAAQTPDVAKLTRDLASPSAEVRRAAAGKLKDCADACIAAVPALVKMMEGGTPGDVRDAGYALRQILNSARGIVMFDTPPATFVEGCRTVRPTVRRKVNAMGPTKDPDAISAQMGTVSLLDLCVEVEDVPSLARIVSSAGFSANVRMIAINVLKSMGPAAVAAVPALQAVGGNASDEYADLLAPLAKAAIESIQRH